MIKSNQPQRSIHESGIELKVFIRGTDVVASAENTLEHQSHSHGVENTKLLWDSLNIKFNKTNQFPSSTDANLVHNVAPSLRFNDVIQLVYFVFPGFIFGHDQESQAKSNVADVTFRGWFI